MLSLLWIFQVVFLDDFYQAIRKQTVISSTDAAVSALSESDFSERIADIALRNDVCITLYDADMKQLLNSDEANPQCRGISHLPPQEAAAYVAEAQRQDGKTFSFQDVLEKQNDPQPALEDPYPFFLPKGRFMQGMTQVTMVSMKDGSTGALFVFSQITPVDATVGTIRSKLLIITAILFLFGILIAFLMARKIAEPIIAINESAKQLAMGNYDVQFHGKGYLEIAELNHTLNYAAKELAKVEKLRQDLIANMSHDLRTPLTMISGYGEMMRDIPNENNAENLQVIIDEAKRLADMVNDVLDLSKIQSGTQKLTMSSFNITDMLRHDIRRYQKMLEHEGYTFIFSYDKEAFAYGDENKLNQAVYNLISNAVRYCGEDKQILVKQTVWDHSVKVEVSDHGEGILPEDLPYVWDRYYKADKTHEGYTIGSGLGLSIVKGILELHGCTYGVHSCQEEGTTFWFLLDAYQNHEIMDKK